MKLVIVDTSISNIYSLKSAFKFLGASFIVSKKYDDITRATHIILPGIGSFDKGMEQLQKNNLKNILFEEANIKKKPILGICLGMQLLFENSEEGYFDGLSILKGEIKKLKSDNKSNFKIPNVGFNKIHIDSNIGIFENLNENYFYFTHSFALIKTLEKMNYATTKHCVNFISSFQKNNICGCQFHPEKSQSSGLQFLKNFLKLD